MLSQTVKPKRILIVDDEATLIFFLRKDFQEADIRSHVDVALSGEEALKKLTYNHYDLLITDLNMPGISGLTLVEIARSAQPNIKVICMTAFGSPEVETEAANLQVNGYLTKPFPTTHLLRLAGDILSTDNLQTTSNSAVPVTNRKPEHIRENW